MNQLLKTFSAIVLIALMACSQQTPKSTTNRPPNFVIVFIDDMGYGDISCQGATGWQTPNLDNMAANGMRFTNFYAAQPVCSASRAGIMTGCYPNRIGISHALFPHDTIGINSSETTIAEMLKTKGYATGIFGKWHLGHHKQFLPLQHGFDEYFGLPYSNDMWPIDLKGHHRTGGKWDTYPDLPLMKGNEIIDHVTTYKAQDQLTTQYTENAVDFINRHADEPFFLYVPHSMGHIPLGVSEKFRGKSEQGLYGDVMMEIDWSVGEIQKALSANNIDDNTVFIFTTDNGPWLNYGNHAGSSGGLREGKTTSWEGGQRVPFLVKWPQQIQAGTICNKLGCAVDLLPSFAALSGAELPKQKIDGVNIVDLWKGKENANPRETVFFYYGKNNLNAVRKGNWKLVLPHTWRSYNTRPGMDGHGGPRKQMTVETPELYNMMHDAGEQNNIAEYFPEKVEELMKVVEEARAELGDLNVGLERGKGTREVGRLQQ